MTAYYNEIDPYAAAWLRNLVAAGRIAAGDVDERSIRDVKPDDLKAYTQCHFFAGIGVWSAALRLAGWADDRPVWTGSCPCQPFSAAGKGGGFDDERHLWPDLFRLIAECKPGVVFGEQVASKDGLAWLDLVQADLEGADYASAAVDLCAAGVGAPHIRQRLYWVADAMCGRAGYDARESMGTEATADLEDGGVPGQRLRAGIEGSSGKLADAAHQQQHGSRDAGSSGRDEHSDGGAAIGLADANSGGHNGWTSTGGEQQGTIAGDADDSEPGGLADANHAERGPDAARGDERHGSDTGRPQGSGDPEGCVEPSGLDHGDDARLEGHGRGYQTSKGWVGSDGSAAETGEPSGVEDRRRARPTNGQWRDADWLFCRDGKWRPVEPGTFPLVDGATSRVGRLRAYGNAIVPQVAAEVIGAWMEVSLERKD